MTMLEAANAAARDGRIARAEAQICGIIHSVEARAEDEAEELATNIRRALNRADLGIPEPDRIERRMTDAAGCTDCNAVSETLERSHGVAWPAANDAARAAAAVHEQVHQERARLRDEVARAAEILDEVDVRTFGRANVAELAAIAADMILEEQRKAHAQWARAERATADADRPRAEIERLTRERDNAHAALHVSESAFTSAAREHGRARDRLLGIFGADWSTDEYDEMSPTGLADLVVAEIERLRAEVATLRERPARDAAANEWEPGWWDCANGIVSSAWNEKGDLVGQVKYESAAIWLARVWTPYGAKRESRHPTRRAAIEWCNQQPQMAAVIAAHLAGEPEPEEPKVLDYNGVEITVGASVETTQGHRTGGVVAGIGPSGKMVDVVWSDSRGYWYCDVLRVVTTADAVTDDDDLGDVPGGTPTDAGDGQPTPTAPARIVGPREGEDWCGRGRHAGTVPYGYYLDEDSDDPCLLTDQGEAAVMLEIVAGVGRGDSATQIARTLNGGGHRTRSGAHWTRSSVCNRIACVDEWDGVEVER